MQYFWTMKNNVGAEIVMKVRKVGRYQYKIYQTSEKKIITYMIRIAML